jgi:drug/metabolite transporter (DMT)-like permease
MQIPRAFTNRISALLVAVAAALWASDAYFRPALTQQLSASQIVFVEDLLIALCFLPALGRIRRELAGLPLRSWLALAIVALGAQAFATFLFTRSLSYAFPAHAAPDFSVENEVYLLYLLQPIFGVTLARIVLRERRRPFFWPLAALALLGVYFIIFPQQPLAPFSSVQHGQVAAAALVLGAVLLWASGTVFGRYALADISFVTTAAMRFWLALPALLVLMLAQNGTGAFGQFSLHQLPSFLGIALIPGLFAMLLYYRGLASTPASVATIAELAYPCTLFLVFSLPPPVGLGTPLYAPEVAGAVLLVAAVTALNLLKDREVVQAPPERDEALAAERAS